MTDKNKIKSASKKPLPLNDVMPSSITTDNFRLPSKEVNTLYPLKSHPRTYQSNDVPTILFLSKRGMSRSPLAQEVMRNLIQKSSLFGRVRVSSRGVNIAYNDCAVDTRMQTYASKIGLILHSTAKFATVPDLANAALTITMDADSEDFVKIHKHAIRGEVRPIGIFLQSGSEPYIKDPYDREDEEDVDERYDSIISSISFSCTKLLSVVPNLIL